MTINRQWLVKQQPIGIVSVESFVANEAAVPQPGTGEILVRVRYVSLDPAYRLYMEPTDNHYLPHPAM